MKKALIGKNKFKFVNGSIPVPDSFDPSYDAWERCNNMVHSWLINSVSPSIAESVMFTENAFDVWNELKERFAQVDRVRIAELQHELYQFKQGTQSVTDFFTQLKIMWEELEAYRPMPLCTCAMRCVCNAIKNSKQFREEDCVMRFLMGLNDSFSMVQHKF